MLTVDFCSLENNEHTDRITQTSHSAEASVRVAAALASATSRVLSGQEPEHPSRIFEAAVTTTCRDGITPTCSTLDTSCCDAVPHVFWMG
jgi:hypothetical protein